MRKFLILGVLAVTISCSKKVESNAESNVMLEEPVATGSNTVWGCISPLECSNVEYDSNANGKLVTYTLSAPEGSAGNTRVVTSAAAATTIISKSV